MDLKKETLSIAWCDNGMVDGKFTQGLVHTIVQMQRAGVPIANALRVQGNQIARQRDTVINEWFNGNLSDWLLWVDSDIVLTADIVAMLTTAADKVLKPIVSGIYFISKQPEGELSYPFPVVFNDIDKNTIQHIHPLPINEVIKVDCAGMGLVLMHRSVVEALKKVYGKESLFAENTASDEREFVGEDVNFFRKVKKVGIQLYAHTGAIAGHMKRYTFDYSHYSMWWHDHDRKEQAKLEAGQGIELGTVR
jgi:hypothetical protein